MLFEAHAVAYRLYRQAPIIPAIDHYNLAPEAYGAVVARTDGHGVPAITKPLLATTDGLLGLRPFDASRDGRIPMIFEVASRLAREFPETEVAVPVDGPFSIASALAMSDCFTDVPDFT